MIQHATNRGELHFELICVLFSCALVITRTQSKSELYLFPVLQIRARRVCNFSVQPIPAAYLKGVTTHISPTAKMDVEQQEESFQQQALEIRKPGDDFDPKTVPQNGEEFLMHMFYERKLCPAVVVKPVPRKKQTMEAANSTDEEPITAIKKVSVCASECAQVPDEFH